MRNGYKVFDAHTHVGEWGTWEVKGRQVSPFTDPITSQAGLRDQMDRYGIDKQIVMPHYHPDLAETFDDNSLAVDLAELDGVYAALFFAPAYPEACEQVRDFARSEDVVALKTSADAWDTGSYDPASWNATQTREMEDMLDFAADHDLPIQFHTGSDASDPRHLFELVDAYPDVTYHCVHAGGTGGGHLAFVPRFLDRLDMDVYCDTSWTRGFGARWIARELKERDALDRLLFASDEPWGEFPGEFGKVDGLAIADDVKQRLLFDNAARLYTR